MALVQRVLNTEKKMKVEGDVFHLIFLGSDAVLYDHLFDSPIIYGPKLLVKMAVTSPTKLPALKDQIDGKLYETKVINLNIYKIQDNGSFKQIGTAIKGKPTELSIPNF